MHILDFGNKQVQKPEIFSSVVSILFAGYFNGISDTQIRLFGGVGGKFYPFDWIKGIPRDL